MLTPHDFAPAALHDPLTRELMAKMTFEHGGAEYDAKYPDGIPTSMVIIDEKGETFDSGLVMYPGGHARNDRGPDKVDLKDVLNHKFETLGSLATDTPKDLIKRISTLEKKSAKDVAGLYAFEIRQPSGKFD
jgi:2-methylcitrate dehydratase